MIPISLASFIGPLIFGKYFDTFGRRVMMCSTYLLSGILVIITGLLF